MLWQDERSSFEHQDSARALLVAIEKVLRDDRAECAATDDDGLERADSRARNGLIEAVAHVATQNVSSEIRRLRDGTCHDLRLP
jgi:hypothetical protein